MVRFLIALVTVASLTSCAHKDPDNEEENNSRGGGERVGELLVETTGLIA